MYFANDASDIYKENGGTVFQTFEIKLWVQLLGTLGFAVLGGLIGFLIGICAFHSKEHEQMMKSFKEHILKRKQDEKDQKSSPEAPKLNPLAAKLGLGIIRNNELLRKVTKVFEQEGYKVDEQLKEKIEQGDYRSLKQAEEKLLKWDLKYSERKGRKWLTMLAGVILLGIAGWFIMPLTMKLKHSLYNREGLASITEVKFGEVKMSEVLTYEVLIVAYDFRHHVPVMFTKYAATNPNTSQTMDVMIRDAA